MTPIGLYYVQITSHEIIRMDYALNLSSGFFDCLWAEAAVKNSGALEPDWGFGVHHPSYGASHRAQLVKNLPAVQETWVLSLGWEDLYLKQSTDSHLRTQWLRDSLYILHIPHRSLESH